MTETVVRPDTPLPDRALPGPAETRLFRLSIVLKLAFWIALIAVLGKALWSKATGGELANPAMLIGIVFGLAILQLGAMMVWWRVRSARRKAERGAGAA